MKIYEEKSLRDFEFWSGGKQNAKNFTDEEMDFFEENFEEIYPEGMEDTTINDIFWFEMEWLVEQLTYMYTTEFEREQLKDRFGDYM